MLEVDCTSRGLSSLFLLPGSATGKLRVSGGVTAETKACPEYTIYPTLYWMLEV